MRASNRSIRAFSFGRAASRFVHCQMEGDLRPRFFLLCGATIRQNWVGRRPEHDGREWQRAENRAGAPMGTSAL